MRYTKLPHTDIEVSVIAMGCWALAGDMTWGDQAEQDSIDAARAALDAGINFFDTAPMYGDGLSEQSLGNGLKGLRDKAVVATKIGPDSMTAELATKSVEKSLADLNMDHIDLIQVHWPSHEISHEETWGALEKLKEQGKVRAMGISNFGPKDLADFMKVPGSNLATSNQLPYSMLARAIEFEIIPACEKAGMGILCYSPLMWGLLADKYMDADEVPLGRARSRHFSAEKRKLTRHGEAGCEEEVFAALAQIRNIAKRLNTRMQDLAIAWLLHQPAVTAVLAGIRVPQQATDNAKAADLQLDTATLSELDQATAAVKQHLGSNPDLWQGGSDSRYR